VLKLDLVSSKDEYEVVRPLEKDSSKKMMTPRRLDGQAAMNISLVGELYVAVGHDQPSLKLYLLSSKDEYWTVFVAERWRRTRTMAPRRPRSRTLMNILPDVVKTTVANGHGARAPLNLYYRGRASIGRISLP